MESERRRERWRWQWRFGGFHRPSTSPFVASSMAVPSITWFFLSHFPVWMLRKYRKRWNSGRTFGGSKLVYLFSFSFILWASGFLWKCLFCFWWSIFRFGFIFQASLPNEAVYEEEKSRVTVSELVFHLLIFFSSLLECLLCRFTLFVLFWYKFQWPKQLNAPLGVVDPEIADIIELEKARQWKVKSLSL